MKVEAGNQPSRPSAFAPSALQRRAVPARDVVGLRDPGDVLDVGADVDVGAVRREAADEAVDRAQRMRPAPEPIACHAAGVR